MSAREVIGRALRDIRVRSHALYIDEAEHILASLSAAGLVVLPAEPTPEMDERAHDAIAMEIVVVGEGIEITEGAPGRILRAMLAAAQEGDK